MKPCSKNVSQSAAKKEDVDVLEGPIDLVQFLRQYLLLAAPVLVKVLLLGTVASHNGFLKLLIVI